MKVLVLGGTGAIGTHLVDNLVQKRINTSVTSRSQRESGKNLLYLHGNAKNIQFIEKILGEQWDAIVDFMVYKTTEFKERVDLFLNSTLQYVFLSSARVYADSTEPLKEDSERLLDVSEDNEYLSTDEYGLSKARQEDILTNTGKNNWTIIRPYITYSKNRLQLGVLEKEEWLYRALKGRTIVFSKDMISKKTTLTYGADVSNGIFALIEKSKASGNTFHITNKQSHTWEEILKIYTAIFEKNLGFKPKVSLQDLDNFIEIHPAKYQIEYDRLFNREFDNSKIDEFIDTDRFLTAERGLEECLTEFLKNPKFKIINWKLEAIKDKQTKEKTPLYEINGLKQKIKYMLFRYFPIIE
jgi:nucleoside-diphosphate-sugar epimerase